MVELCSSVSRKVKPIYRVGLVDYTLLLVCKITTLSLSLSSFLPDSMFTPHRYLAAGSGLPMLQYLNLSGLPNVTQKGLSSLVATSPKLPPDLLFYCDHIMAGPYPETANGCLNVSNTTNIQCCRMRM